MEAPSKKSRSATVTVPENLNELLSSMTSISSVNELENIIGLQLDGLEQAILSFVIAIFLNNI